MSTINQDNFNDADTVKLVETYQCPGCIHGSNSNCGYFERKSRPEVGCRNHVAGTLLPGKGKLLLGMPNGFNRIGKCHCNPGNYVYVYKNVGDDKSDDLEKTTFQIPIWKHLDQNGNTLLRLALPRLGNLVTAVVAGNQLQHFDCLEITNEDILKMD